MPEQVTKLTVFAASPGDVQPERDALGRVVDELNRTTAGQSGFVLELERWETHVRPGAGSDAQAVINRQIREPDALVGIFWSRLGTPTPRAESGTAEEIEAALDRWQRDHRSVEVLTYFSRAAQPVDKIDPDQLQRLRDFKDDLQSRGLLTRDYDSVGEFERLVRQHLSAWVRDAAQEPVESRAGLPAAAASKEDLSPARTLAVEVNVRHNDQIMRLSSEVRSLLTSWSFVSTTADTVLVCMNELLANVAKHTEVSTALLELDVLPEFSKGVSIDVYSQGQPFDLDHALESDLDAVSQGDREHGLLAIARLTGNLHRATKYEDRRLIGVGCYVHDPEPRYPQYLRAVSELAVVSIEADARDRFWVGSQFRYGKEVAVILKYAVEHGSLSLLESFFKEICDGGSRLAIEYSGGTPITSIFEVMVDEPHPSFSHVRSRRPLRAALEALFPQAFLEGRVVMLSHGTGYAPDLSEWAELWGIPHHHSPHELIRHLQES